MNWKKTLLISLTILLIGAGITYYIFSTEPTAQRSGATKETAMLVDVVQVERGSYQPQIVATGTVQPAKEIMLSPRVSGEILSISSAFTPGGFVKKGQTLMQIDPADYETILALRNSELAQAKSDLQLEMGQQSIAKQDYALLGDTLPEREKALVLRQPQLQAVKARIKAAEANVQQAELNLQRTTIKAPFNALILSRNANVGSQVANNSQLGRLVGVNEYWVMVNVPLSQIRRLNIPQSGNRRGSSVKLKNRVAWPDSVYRTGYIKRRVGALDTQTRLAQIMVAVDNPLAYGLSEEQSPPLTIGAFLEAEIQAEKINNVFRLNRDFIREDETVWVMKDGQLRIRKAEIVFQDAQYAYIKSGLQENDAVVTTNLSTVVDGAALRTENSTSTNKQDSLAISDLRK
jgi:RND family efflux transporter MFP subunit